MDLVKISVSRTLLEQFKIEVSPGQKIDCPFCYHHTFSIKPDDLLAKCFHPDCRRFVGPAGSSSKHEIKLFEILQELYQEASKELRQQSLDDSKNAYSYLIIGRSVHKDVVDDALLGAMPKVTLVYEKLLLCQASLDEEIKQLEMRACTGKNSKRDAQEMRKTLRSLKETFERVTRIIEMLKSGKYVGWLCFFYTDSLGNIVSVRLREPYSKNFVSFKPFKDSGVFGLTLFKGDAEQVNLSTIVVEGEFNLLQMQSLTLRRAEHHGAPSFYQNAIAVGSATTPDLLCVKKVCPVPIFVYDNDKSLAGYQLVEKAKEYFSCQATTTPDVDSDLDSFICNYGEDIEAAWKGLTNLLSNLKFIPRDFNSVKHEVTVARLPEEKDVKELSIHLAVVRIIQQDLLDRAMFYRSGEGAYLFLKFEKVLIKVEEGDLDCIKFFSKYGIVCTEKIFNYVIESIRIHILENGIDTVINRLSYYNQKTNTLYLQNGQSSLFKISSSEILKADNGCDGIIFIANKQSKPFDLVDCPPDVSYIDTLILSSTNFSQSKLGDLTIGERKLILLIWILSNYFKSIMPTRPILAIIGPKGSSKTSCIRRVGKLIIGPEFDVMPLSDKPDDFDAAVSNSPFVAIDNADTKCNWLNDKLAVIATGGTYLKRKLYTTNSMVEILLDCFLAITSRTPQFKRDDVNDRLLIMFVERMEKFISEKQIQNDICDSRNELMTELVYHLQSVVEALEAQEKTTYSGPFRMADFADFALKIGAHFNLSEEMKNIFSKLGREQSRFTLEDDPVARLLILWVTDNPNVEITNVDLCQKLSALAKQKILPFPFAADQGKSFAHYMTSLRPNLEEFFDITSKNHGGHRVTFMFKLKSEGEI